MAVIIIDGRTRVSWLAAIANIALPTTTELNGGTGMETDITPDGLNIKGDNDKVDVGNVASSFTLEEPGRRKYDSSVTCHHRSGTDTVFNLLTYQTRGFLVVRKGVALSGAAWASGQLVQVYPMTCGEYSDEEPKPNSTWKFMVPFMLNAEPNTRALVA